MAVSVCEEFPNYPLIFEEESRALSARHALDSEGETLLLSLVSILTRLALGIRVEESELKDMRRLRSELSSLDSDGRLGKALSEWEALVRTFSETSNVPR